MPNRIRCPWSEQSEPEKQYHDNEWGVPSYDDRYFFEMLILEGAQAGLSWSTVLNKRDRARTSFAIQKQKPWPDADRNRKSAGMLSGLYIQPHFNLTAPTGSVSVDFASKLIFCEVV